MRIFTRPKVGAPGLRETPERPGSSKHRRNRLPGRRPGSPAPPPDRPGHEPKTDRTMKRLLLLLLLLAGTAVQGQNRFEERFTRPLGEVLDEIAARFDVRFKCDVPTDGLRLAYADFRIRPYSLDETLTAVLGPFDLRYVREGEKQYRIKAYEYNRRTAEEGAKLLAWLESRYTDRAAFEERAARIRREVRERLEIDPLLAQRVPLAPIRSKIRRFDGYTVQNFAIQTLPGLYVCGSVYAPAARGKHPVVVCPNGHFGDGRYRKDQQLRLASLARMGIVAADYDLVGWGESELQLTSVAHRTSYAQQLQALNGITVLDMLLARADADATRVGVNGGSGGGAQSVLLTVLDDRYTALCPVVSLSAHFDGGCPCESGMPVTLAAGGTCNAEMAAIFAPRPLCVVSDGKDWTRSVPTLEYPYLQRVYALCGAADRLSNVHLAGEGHDFGPSKRTAVYDFFASAFGLDRSKADEARVTIEPREALCSFGAQGEKLPADAIRSINGLAPYFGKARVRTAAADESVLRKAQEIVGKLDLADPRAESVAVTAVYNHRRAVRDWHNSHPYTVIPEVEAETGRKLSKVEREMMADRLIPAAVHDRLVRELGRVLTPEQTEQVFDGYTAGKVAFTMQGYRAIVPDLTETEAAALEGYLKEARKDALECKSMKAISQVFEIYKTKCEQYLNTNGRDWRALFKAYVDKRNAEKKAAQADKEYIAKSAKIVAALSLQDAAKAEAVTKLVEEHRRAVVEWHNAHPYTAVAESDPATGRRLSDVEREMTADRQIPASVRRTLLKGLRRHLSPAQIEQIYDGYTVGKVAFTMKGYYAIVPDLTEKEAAVLEGYLKQAREEALECRRMKAVSQVFEIYKTKCEHYLNAHGRDWRALFKAYVDKRNAEKRAAEAAARTEQRQ